MPTTNNMKNKARPNDRIHSVGRGFTIVESLVAITILVLVVTGVASAIQTGISSYIFSKDQIIAFYLAQEGFEQIRNIRDENALKDPPQPWLTGISNSGDPCEFNKTCAADPVPLGNPLLFRCGDAPGSCPVLRQSSSGFFGYDSSWSPTIFRREIVLTQINPKEISVLVTVNWSKGVVNRQFRTKENLLNWQQ
ncbi:MAG: prepilin-type N-terminal cleavage/methylation domain-containing protein [bacterium]|nr:prepilin-type N-terminal cleavage/methylation domain-containing protein [bacterium]